MIINTLRASAARRVAASCRASSAHIFRVCCAINGTSAAINPSHRRRRCNDVRLDVFASRASHYSLVALCMRVCPGAVQFILLRCFALLDLTHKKNTSSSARILKGARSEMRARDSVFVCPLVKGLDSIDGCSSPHHTR